MSTSGMGAPNVVTQLMSVSDIAPSKTHGVSVHRHAHSAIRPKGYLTNNGLVDRVLSERDWNRRRVALELPQGARKRTIRKDPCEPLTQWIAHDHVSPSLKTHDL